MNKKEVDVMATFMESTTDVLGTIRDVLVSLNDRVTVLEEMVINAKPIKKEKIDGSNK